MIILIYRFRVKEIKKIKEENYVLESSKSQEIELPMTDNRALLLNFSINKKD